MDFLKSLDEFSKPQKRGANKKFLSVWGGLLQVIVWLIVVTYTIVYIKQTVDEDYPINSMAHPFPVKTAEWLGKGAIPFRMPILSCRATNGCYYKEEGMTSTGVTKPCKWYAKGQNLPTMELVYSTKPAVSILSTDTSEWVSVAYDMTRMEKPTNPIKTTSSTGNKFEIPMGLTTMNVERIRGVTQKNGDVETVNTWLASLTSDISSFAEAGHGCCNDDVMVMDQATGAWTTDPTKTALMTECAARHFSSSSTNYWWTTRIVAPSYYTLVEISDPLSASSLFGYIGGWMGTLTILAALLYIASMQLFKILGWVTDVKDDDEAPAGHTAVPTTDGKRHYPAKHHKEVELRHNEI